ncbi:MAG: glycosyltransferase [Pirellulales bacterium]|nr:glycosyltransferase [Pirellulales bacterium]
MPRILFIIDSLGYHGAATQLLALAKGLLERGYEVHVAALHADAPRRGELGSAGINTAILPRRCEIDPLADLRLVRHVRRLRPNIVHTWNTVPGMLGPIANHIPFVATIDRIDRWKSACEWAIERRFAQYAKLLLTNSPTVKAWAVEHGLPAKKFRVLPSGIAVRSARELDRSAILETYSLPSDARLIGVVGQLVPAKRVKDLLWAADLLRVLHDNLRLLVVGAGPLRPQLEEYARLASDLEHIRFLGDVADASKLMSCFEVLWNAGDNVAQSAAVLEAMAAGTPVIASDTAVNRELVVEGETGFLIPLGSRAGRAARARYTDQIFQNAELAARLSAAARGRVELQHGLEQYVEQHIQVYSVS